MAPKRKASIGAGERKRDLPGGKRQKVTKTDSINGERDELASDSECKEQPKSGRDPSTTGKLKSSNASASKNSPKASLHRNTTTEPCLRETRATTMKKVTALEHDMKLLQQEDGKLKEQNSQLKKQIRALREQEHASKYEGGQYMQEDQSIKQSLSDLSKMIWDWSARWARKGTIAQHTNLTNAELPLKALHGRHGLLHCALRDNIDTVLIWQPGGPRVAVQAILDHLVAEQVLLLPFHFLKIGHKDGKGISESSLLGLYSCMRADSPDKMLWPARTLRSLYAYHQLPTSSVEPILDDRFEADRGTIRQQLVRFCLDGGKSLLSSLLLASDDDGSAMRRMELSRIFDIAAKVSLRIWIQGAIPTVHWQGSACFTKGFSPDHTHFDPHQLMKSDLDDKSLLNRAVDWVVRPCVTFRRFYADGSQTADVMALKGQVMLLNMEKCRPKASSPKHEPTNNGTQILNIRSSEATEIQSIRTKSTDGGVTQAQKDEDNAVVTSATASVTKTLQDGNTSGSDTTQDEQQDEKDVRVDHEATEPISSPTAQSSSERKDMPSSAPGRNTSFIDLTGDEQQEGVDAKPQALQEQAKEQAQVAKLAGETEKAQSRQSSICSDDGRPLQAGGEVLASHTWDAKTTENAQINVSSNAEALTTWYDFGNQVLESATPEEHDEWQCPGNATDFQHSPSNLDRLSGNRSRHKIRSESVTTYAQTIEEPGKQSPNFTTETSPNESKKDGFVDAPEQLFDSPDSSSSLSTRFGRNFEQIRAWSCEKDNKNESGEAVRKNGSQQQLANSLLHQNGTAEANPGKQSHRRSQARQEPEERKTPPPHLSNGLMRSPDRHKISRSESRVHADLRPSLQGQGSLTVGGITKMQELSDSNLLRKDIEFEPDDNLDVYFQRHGFVERTTKQDNTVDVEMSDVSDREPEAQEEPADHKPVPPCTSPDSTTDKACEEKPQHEELTDS